MKIKILYIDDELHNLIGFKASFRLEYNVLIANNTTEAFDILLKNPDIRVIFCDQRMPSKTGSQFFQEIRSQFPNPIRILLTGYSDIESVIEGINLGNIFRYVKKPWSDADITTSIEEANKFYMLSSMLSIKNEALKKAYFELDKFAHSVTHDMRRPLLSILGAIEVAHYIDDVTEVRQMLNMMEDSVKNLDSYIQSTHDYYNIKRGELKIEEINLQEMVKEGEDIIRSNTETQNVRLTTNVSQQEVFRSDKVSMKIILHNLLSNAFKYQQKDNPDKFVDLDINISTGLATISVKDNGIGIPKSHIGEIFDMFYRASSDEVGTGFGLYNVKDALLKLNGEIKVESEVNVGTTFEVIIRNK